MVENEAEAVVKPIVEELADGAVELGLGIHAAQDTQQEDGEPQPQVAEMNENAEQEEL